jgi:RNA polymerase sigma-70 factor (ECF subfamily)
MAEPTDFERDLVRACLSGDRSALDTFEREVLSTLDRSLARMKLGARLEDVKQRVRQLLFVARPGETPKIATWSGRGRLTAFVRIIAVREAIDLLEKERHETAWEPAQLAAVPVSDDDPELGYMKRSHRAAFKEAFECAFLSLPPRMQNLLRQQVIDGLTVVELGALYRVHHATAARWLVAARSELNLRTRKELTLRLRLSSSECDSLLRLSNSYLAQSLSGLFRGVSPSSS